MWVTKDGAVNRNQNGDGMRNEDGEVVLPEGARMIDAEECERILNTR
jgi:hypothetical protein